MSDKTIPHNEGIYDSTGGRPEHERWSITQTSIPIWLGMLCACPICGMKNSSIRVLHYCRMTVPLRSAKPFSRHKAGPPVGWQGGERSIVTPPFLRCSIFIASSVDRQLVARLLGIYTALLSSFLPLSFLSLCPSIPFNSLGHYCHFSCPRWKVRESLIAW